MKYTDLPLFVHLALKLDEPLLPAEEPCNRSISALWLSPR